MKTLELTAEQMEENCPFCGAEHWVSDDPLRGLFFTTWSCGTKARLDSRVAKQSLECRVNELGKWIGGLADELAEVREGKAAILRKLERDLTGQVFVLPRTIPAGDVVALYRAWFTSDTYKGFEDWFAALSVLASTDIDELVYFDHGNQVTGKKEEVR